MRFLLCSLGSKGKQRVPVQVGGAEFSRRMAIKSND